MPDTSIRDHRAAIKKHGSAAEAVLNEDFGLWPIGEAMQLFASLARELARAEQQRRQPL